MQPDDVQPDDVQPGVRGASARVRGWVATAPGWARWVAVLCGLAVLVSMLGARFGPARTALSRADEYVYIDAVDKAARGEVTRRGASVDEYALALIACRGVDGQATMGETCGGPYDLDTFPYDGVTSADIHSPVYSFVTAWGAAALDAVTPLDGLLLAARATSLVWLVLGLAAVVALARALGASRTASAAVALMVLAAPAVRWSNLFVTPDALNLLVGAGIALAAVRYAQRRWSPWILIGLAFLVTLVKAQNSIVCGLAALVLVLHAATAPDRSLRSVGRAAVVAAGTVASAVVAQAGWTVLRGALAVGDPPVLDPVQPFSVGMAVQQVRAFLFVVTLGPDATYPPALEQHQPALASILISWLLGVGVLAAALFGGLRGLQARFAQATAAVLLLAGPFLYAGIQLTTGRGFHVPDRYGMVLVPAMAAATAVVARRRWVLALMIGVAAWGFVEALITYRMV